MRECLVCGDTDYQEIAGHFYCNTCNTQSQSTRVELNETEFEDYGGVLTQIKEKKKTDEKEKKQRKGKVVDKGQPWSIYEAYQLIMQHQIEALIKLGAKPELEGIVFKIWTNYLNRLGVAFSDQGVAEPLAKRSRQREMFPGTTQDPKVKNVLGRSKRRKTVGVSAKTREKETEKQQMAEAIQAAEGADGVASGEEEGEEGGGQKRKKKKKRKKDEFDFDGEDADDEDAGARVMDQDLDVDGTRLDLWDNSRRHCLSGNSIYKMQMVYTLSFCYLGLMATNPLTTLVDIIRWVAQEKIPYLNATDIISSKMKFCLHDWKLFGEGIVPILPRLRSRTSAIGRFLEFPNTPCLRFPLEDLLIKYIMILDLPGECNQMVRTLSRRLEVSKLQTFSIAFWEGMAMAIIIILLKMLFGVDDKSERFRVKKSQLIPFRLENRKTLMEKGICALKKRKDTLHAFKEDVKWAQAEIAFVEEALPSKTLPESEPPSKRLRKRELCSKTLPELEPPSKTLPKRDLRSKTLPECELSSKRLSDGELPSKTLIELEPPSKRLRDCVLPGKTLPEGEPPSKRLRDRELPSKTLPEGEPPSKRLRDRELPSKTLPEGEPPSKRLRDCVLPRKTLPEGEPSSKRLRDRELPSKTLPEGEPYSKRLLDRELPSKTLPECEPFRKGLPEREPSSKSLPECELPSKSLPEREPPSKGQPEHELISESKSKQEQDQDPAPDHVSNSSSSETEEEPPNKRLPEHESPSTRLPESELLSKSLPECELISESEQEQEQDHVSNSGSSETEEESPSKRLPELESLSKSLPECELISEYESEQEQEQDLAHDQESNSDSSETEEEPPSKSRPERESLSKRLPEREPPSKSLPERELISESESEQEQEQDLAHDRVSNSDSSETEEESPSKRLPELESLSKSLPECELISEYESEQEQEQDHAHDQESNSDSSETEEEPPSKSRPERESTSKRLPEREPPSKSLPERELISESESEQEQEQDLAHDRVSNSDSSETEEEPPSKRLPEHESPSKRMPEREPRSKSLPECELISESESEQDLAHDQESNSVSSVTEEEHPSKRAAVTEDKILRDSEYPKIYIRKQLKSLNSSSGQAYKKKHSRVYNNYHSCYYCEELFLHIPVHMKVHRNIPKVRDELRKPKPDFTSLRKLGDDEHNRKVVDQKKGELILSRKSNDKTLDITKYGPCVNCREWYLLSGLKRHFRKCAKGDKKRMGKKDLVITAQILAGHVVGKPSKMMLEEVYRIMKNDECSRTAKNDMLIRSLGESWLRRNLDNYEKRKYYASGRMRLCARLLNAIKAQQPQTESKENKDTDDTMWDFLVPSRFDDFVAASLAVSTPHMDDMEDLRAPSNALKLKYDIRRLLNAKYAYLLRSGDVHSDEIKGCKRFLKLMEIEWGERVTKVARTVLQIRRLSETKEIPAPDDVEKLTKHLVHELETAKMTQENYARIVQLCQTRLLLFNKRRSGELEVLDLQSYLQRSSSLNDLDESISKDLTDIEKHLLKSQGLVMIRGKRGRPVPVIVPQDANKPLEFITKAEVRQAAGVQRTNKYLFANRGTQYVRAYDSLKSVCDEVTLKAPARITSVSMRKYMATLTQLMGLDKYQLDWVCKHLGHTKSVHNTAYRQMSGMVERVYISKLLMIQDLNLTGKFKGQNLEDIDVSELLNGHQSLTQESDGVAESDAVTSVDIITPMEYNSGSDVEMGLFSAYSKELNKEFYNGEMKVFVWDKWISHVAQKINLINMTHKKHSEEETTRLDRRSKSTKLSDIKLRLYQNETREKIRRPFDELSRKWQRKSRRNPGSSVTSSVYGSGDEAEDLNMTQDTLVAEDPDLAYTLNAMDAGLEDEPTNQMDDTSHRRVLKAGEMFRSCTLQHLVNPEQFLSKHGIDVSSHESQSEDDLDSDTDEDGDKEISKTKKSSASSSNSFKLNSAKCLMITTQVEFIKAHYRIAVHSEKSVSHSSSYNWLVQLGSKFLYSKPKDLQQEIDRLEMTLMPKETQKIMRDKRKTQS